MNIAKLAEKTETLRFSWEGEEIEIEFFANALTPTFVHEISLAQKEGDLKLLSKVAEKIRKWNLDYNGEPFPPTPSNFETLPVHFVTHITEAIFEVWGGNVQKPTKLASGSAA